MTSDEQSLHNAGVRITAVRLLIWKQLRHGFEGVFSLSDLEEAMPTIDRSTLFRTLTLLSDAHLLHSVDDGSGSQKYCLCHHDDTRNCRGHVHITCKTCHKTYCLTNITIPQIPIPEGFEIEESEYIVKGICPSCLRKKRKSIQ